MYVLTAAFCKTTVTDPRPKFTTLPYPYPSPGIALGSAWGQQCEDDQCLPSMTTLDHVIATHQSEWVSFNEEPLFPVPSEGKECFHFLSERPAKNHACLLCPLLAHSLGRISYGKKRKRASGSLSWNADSSPRKSGGSILGTLGLQTRAWKHQKYWLLSPKEYELLIYQVLNPQCFW